MAAIYFIVALHFLPQCHFFTILSFYLCSYAPQGVTSASYRLAASVIQSCTGKLKSCISQFLTSCILNRDAVGSPLKESYHEIILEIYQVAPELLLSVIPLFTHELLVCYPVTAHFISKAPYHFYLIEFCNLLLFIYFLSFYIVFVLYTRYYYISCHYSHFSVFSFCFPHKFPWGQCNFQTDQVDVRIKVLNLIKKLLELQGKSIAQEYPCVLKELLNRFSDKSAEVRLTALSSSKALYITNLSGRDSLETLFSKLS